jgi:hypothetical protein
VRLAALDATGLLDAPEMAELDDLTRVVAWRSTCRSRPSRSSATPAHLRRDVPDHRPRGGRAGTPREESVCQQPAATA